MRTRRRKLREKCERFRERLRLRIHERFEFIRREGPLPVKDSPMKILVERRLTGFEGHEPAKQRLDTGPYPNFNAAYARMTGDNVARRAVCTGPIAWQDRAPLQKPYVHRIAASGRARRRSTHRSQAR